MELCSEYTSSAGPTCLQYAISICRTEKKRSGLSRLSVMFAVSPVGSTAYAATRTTTPRCAWLGSCGCILQHTVRASRSIIVRQSSSSHRPSPRYTQWQEARDREQRHQQEQHEERVGAGDHPTGCERACAAGSRVVRRAPARATRPPISLAPAVPGRAAVELIFHRIDRHSTAATGHRIILYITQRKLPRRPREQKPPPMKRARREAARQAALAALA